MVGPLETAVLVELVASGLPCCVCHGAVLLGAEPSSPRGQWAFSVSLGELKSIRRSKPGLSWAYLVLVTQAGGSLPALHFHRGGTRALLRVLSRYLLLAR